MKRITIIATDYDTQRILTVLTRAEEEGETEESFDVRVDNIKNGEIPYVR